jgi:hypothetical protein
MGTPGGVVQGKRTEADSKAQKNLPALGHERYGEHRYVVLAYISRRKADGRVIPFIIGAATGLVKDFTSLGR